MLDSHSNASASQSAAPASGVARTAGVDEARLVLADLDQELNRLQRAVRLAIQSKLATFSGRSLGQLDANQELARTVHELLEGHGLRVRCNECGHPAILRVSDRKGVTAGVFVFDHTLDGRRTFHGGSAVFPELRLVAKPARRRPDRAAG